MPFDSDIVYAPTQPAAATPLSLAALIEAIDSPSADWAAGNPTRALAFLMVSPRDCAALDVL